MSRIVVVDDTASFLETIEEYLERYFPEMKVITFTSPYDALAYFKSQAVAPEVLISDYEMGVEMTGIEFLQEVRRLYPATFTIFMSGADNFEKIAPRAGAHRWLRKTGKFGRSLIEFISSRGA